jgi:spore coat protein A
VFQDKVFVPANVMKSDPTWSNVVTDSRPGDLWYAHIYDAELEPGTTRHPIRPSSREFFGDTILCNGTVYPFLEVEQRQYRFRLLNACNSRF